MKTEHAPHSGHYFGDQRDLWWNYDFIELMAKRWDLSSVRSVLDIGCGIGHWGFTLAPFFNNDTQVQGIDPESAWVKKATQRAKEKGVHQQFHYQIGKAEQIPFEDNSFDMVTCQTVLIHVSDINVALKEMIRVLKPGGLLAVAEPNNIAPLLIFNTLSINEPLDNLLEHIQFHITCERGKQALGLGYNSVGDILPYAFSRHNLDNIQVFLSDKTSLMIPPYQSEEEQILFKQIQDWENQEILVWPRDETKRYYLAGGGAEKDFERIWTKLINASNESIQAIKDKKLSSTNATVMYLISGRKKT
ncbi:MAG: class I SAM-dependent methyltransferase [Candidatus Berkiella sp.]